MVRHTSESRICSSGALPGHYFITQANRSQRKYLQFFHLPLDADAVQRFRAVSQLGEASLGGSQPVAEGRAEAVGVLDAPQLLLQLLDGVLRRRTQKVREYRATVELSKKTTTKKLCKYVNR